MNLAAYRQYSETDVINGLFTLVTATGSKGVFLSITGNSGITTGVNPTNNDGWGPSIVPGQPNTYSSRYQVNALVTPTPSGSTPIGMQLWDMIELNPFGEMLLFRPVEQAERQCVLSGQAVPIVRRGIFNIIGVSGTPSGGAFGTARNGALWALPSVPNFINTYTGDVYAGKFLGTTGRDGGALFLLDL